MKTHQLKSLGLMILFVALTSVLNAQTSDQVQIVGSLLKGEIRLTDATTTIQTLSTPASEAVTAFLNYKTFSVNFNVPVGKVSVMVSDSYGNIFAYGIVNTNATRKIYVNMTWMPSGTYFLQLQNNVGSMHGGFRLP